MLGLGDRRREIEHYANLGVLLDASNRHVEAQAALGHVISLTRAEGDRSSELVVLSNLGFEPARRRQGARRRWRRCARRIA